MHSVVELEGSILIIKDNIKLELTYGEANTLMNELAVIKMNKEMEYIYTTAADNDAFRQLAKQTVLEAEKDIESKQRSITTLKKFLQEELENESTSFSS